MVNLFTVYGTLGKGVLYYGDKELPIENSNQWQKVSGYWIISLAPSGLFLIWKYICP